MRRLIFITTVIIFWFSSAEVFASSIQYSIHDKLYINVTSSSLNGYFTIEPNEPVNNPPQGLAFINPLRYLPKRDDIQLRSNLSGVLGLTEPVITINKGPSDAVRDTLGVRIESEEFSSFHTDMIGKHRGRGRFQATTVDDLVEKTAIVRFDARSLDFGQNLDGSTGTFSITSTLPYKLIQLNGQTYGIPIHDKPEESFYITDENGLLRTGVDPATAAKLMLSSKMLSEMEDFDGTQLLQRMESAESELRARAIANGRTASVEAIASAATAVVTSGLGAAAGAVTGLVEGSKLGYSACATVDEVVGILCGAGVGVKGLTSGAIVSTISSIDLGLRDFSSEIGDARRASAVYHSTFEELKGNVVPIPNVTSKNALTIQSQLNELKSKETFDFDEILDSYVDSYEIERKVEVAEIFASAAYSEQSPGQIALAIGAEPIYALIDSITLGQGSALEAQSEVEFFDEAEELALQANAEDFFQGSAFDNAGIYLGAAFLNKRACNRFCVTAIS